eukprot:TRINITY_DN2054_c0_g1_i1.p1 TRINITY_DN2054_c0_g1~~TRINITY_DN2054_c0_g1_i1.p1  ORF type:complete len:194 (+),score=20.62 TRINITY_DN2054_c0_g1_i1:26-607(+)
MKLFLSGLAAASASSFFKYSRTDNRREGNTPTRHALCILYPDSGSNVSGLVSFTQDNITTPCTIVAHVKGLVPNSKHGFHIHEFGDLTQGCVSAGSHYNPFNRKHGGPNDTERHVGDLGNLVTDDKGVAHLSIKDTQIKLFGDTTVVGRSCVVHADEDDLGRGIHPDSTTTGHSGARIACGVIALSNAFKTIQ